MSLIQQGINTGSQGIKNPKCPEPLGNPEEAQPFRIRKLEHLFVAWVAEISHANYPVLSDFHRFSHKLKNYHQKHDLFKEQLQTWEVLKMLQLSHLILTMKNQNISINKSPVSFGQNRAYLLKKKKKGISFKDYKGQFTTSLENIPTLIILLAIKKKSSHALLLSTLYVLF